MKQNVIDYSSNELTKYEELRTEVASRLDAADGLLQECANTLTDFKYESLKPLSEKLRQDRFNLVLTGGFQTGKSTIFSYLCGGRELSPVGDGGGGIPTSAARIVALPIEEGQKEYAIVKWRTHDELLASLGDWIVPYYMEKRHEQNRINASMSCVNSEDINLDNDNDRKQLANIAKDVLSQPHPKLDNIDQARIALLIAWFYSSFKTLLDANNNSKRFDSLEEVTKLSSYPDKWQTRWLQSKTSGWQSEFTEEEASFVFIHSIEYHLDSPKLRQLGCCLVDSPGLSASKWDSDIAAHAMRESDAVLYLFRGDRAISQEDCENIEECIDFGEHEKILFGANLRISEAAWRDNRESSISSLKQQGYNVPHFYDFHAGIALRSVELWALENNCLHQSCINAIDYELKKNNTKCDNQERRNYLEGTLNTYIKALTKPNSWQEGKSLDNYREEAYGERYTLFEELEKLSGIPAFVRAARTQILARKKESLLRQKGSKKIISSLTSASEIISKEITNLESSKNQEVTTIPSLREDLRQLEINISHKKENLLKQFQESDKDIKNHYDEKLINALQLRKHEIIGITANNFIGPFNNIAGGNAPWTPAAQHIVIKFNIDLNSIFRDVLRKLCAIIRDGICQTQAYNNALSEYTSVIRSFTSHHELEELIQHRSIELSDRNYPITAWGGNIMNILAQGNLMAMFIMLMGGGLIGQQTDWQRAADAVNKVWPTIIKEMKDIIHEYIFYRKETPRGPLQQMWDAYDGLIAKLDNILADKQAELTRAEESANKTNAEIDARIGHLTTLKEKIDTALISARTLDGKVKQELTD